MSVEQYAKALKQGERAYRSAVGKGDYPYLPALDEILERVELQREENLGLVDIPLEQIVGTKTSGRKNSFAFNFMPLLSENSEFAIKWENVYNYQMEEGVGDPIIAYEFMNRFYVLEGNKRVSVLKFLNAFSIEGMVTRIVPKPNDQTEVKIYYEFLEFYRLTEINYIWFSKEGSFIKLMTAVGKNMTDVWSEDEKADFSSRFTLFKRLFLEKGGAKLPLTSGDAFLFYLTLYDYHEMDQKSSTEIKAELECIWKELKVFENSPEKSLVLDPAKEIEQNMFSRFFNITSSKVLKVAFVHERSMESSGWTYSHELGRMYLEQKFGSCIQTSSYYLEQSDLDISGLLEEAIEAGNHIIFTTNQKFANASLKMALQNPQVKILNCSVNSPFQSIRTYYGRMYEAKFLSGMIAGTMCTHNKIAYIADYPIYGSVSNINAFARGVQMVNPRARVHLYWSSVTNYEIAEELEKNQYTMVSGVDMIRPQEPTRKFGLYQEENGEVIPLATPIWNWGKFYEKMIRDLLQGNWNKTADVKERKTLNYWWGVSGNILDLIMSQNLPSGVRSLISIMKNEIIWGNVHPFQGEMTKQDGTVIGKEEEKLQPEQIITMDWLLDNVIGEIPGIEELTEEAKELVTIQSTLNL